MNGLNKIGEYLRTTFALDLRAIALMRMALALVIITDLVIRSTSLVAFYTDEGVLPLSVLYRSNWNPSFFSLYGMGTGWKIVALLFILNFIFALLLFFGYKTRLMSVLCWLFLVSLHNRNPIVLQGGDELLRLALFWGIFMPWGQRYSIDAINSDTQTSLVHKKTWFDIPVMGYLSLLFSVYFFSAVYKDSDEWRREGSALYYALSLDQMVWPLGKLIYPYEGLLKFLTKYVFYLELLAPFLLFIPVKNPFFRMVFVALVGTLHVGISVTLYVGLFFLIGLATLIGLLPQSVMDRIEKRTSLIRSLGRKFASPIAELFKKSGMLQFSFKAKLSELAQFQLRLIYRGVLFFVICYNLLWCIGMISNSTLRVSDNFLWFGYTFRFDQNWGMFAPSVYKDDGWYIYEAELERADAGGEKQLIDLNRKGEAVTYEKPENIIRLYENDRWRKFGEIWQLQTDVVKKEFCRYLKNKWNRKHPEKRIGALRIVYMKETTLPDYEPVKVERTVPCDCEKY